MHAQPDLLLLTLSYRPPRGPLHPVHSPAKSHSSKPASQPASVRVYCSTNNNNNDWPASRANANG